MPPTMRISRKRAAFLIALNDRLRPLHDPVEIQREALRIVGEHLGVTWVHYAECDDDLAFVTVNTEYIADGAPSLAGRHALDRCQKLMTELAADRSVAVYDVRESAVMSASRGAEFAAIGTISFVSAPIVKGGRLIATVSAADRAPREWQRDEIELLEATAERTWAAVERARAAEAMAIELRNTRLLHELSARLVTEADADAFFDAILAAAIAITGSIAGSMRLLNVETRELELLTTRGLAEPLAALFRRVRVDEATGPGRAFARRERTFVDFEDPADNGINQEARRAHLETGIVAAQTTPLVTRDGRAIGTLSTHWSERRRPSERELRFLDLLARQAADLIERRIADEALRESKRRLSEELADMQLLQTISAQLIRDEDSTTLYDTLLDAACTIMHSDFAVLQILHSERGAAGEMRLLASRGFSADVARAWEWVPRDARTTCGLALRTDRRIVAPDISHPDLAIGEAERGMYLRIGVRSAQTTPLVSRGGATVGMISTFWRTRHEASDRELRLLDILARQAADLIERAQAAETLRRNEAALKEADRRKDEFLAVLAHELRNPLAPILTSLDVMRRADGAPDVLEEARGMMERQAGHMVRLIDDLLDVSRVASGKIQLQRQPTPLSLLVNTAIETNRAQLDAGQLSLDVDVPDEPVLLDVDATRFIQILSNVLHNAVKFSRPGDRIRFTVTLDRTADAAGHEARFVISDSGAGITPALLPRVFELFAQDSESARETSAGLGIGLALARQLIDIHGGSIEACSDGPGLGSTFTIRLPIPAALAVVQEPAPRREPRRITRRVVVIDDNVDAANSMRRLVTLIGGECRVAHCGEAGLTEVRNFRPDIVFLDIGMPGMDGYEVCRRIRQDRGHDVLVVALTGWGQERNKQESARSGFDVHLTKPADPLVLEAILDGGRGYLSAS